MAEGDTKVKPCLKLATPEPNVKYPITVLYCGECSMPIEYCEYSPVYERCKAWLEKNLPDEYEKLLNNKDDKDGDDDKKKRQTRGGKGMMKVKKKAEPQGIELSTSTRSKKKKVTIVTGLATYEINLKMASKCFASRFSCGASVTSEDEIVIQGDVKDDLYDFIIEKWSQIDEDDIKDID